MEEKIDDASIKPLTDEEQEGLTGFFKLLYKVDKRENDVAEEGEKEE